eukprot:Sspe_Gene.95700::Locus_68006_Transcript_1_1_Confidence_1.000_Length_1513::g.95700::m.95700
MVGFALSSATFVHPTAALRVALRDFTHLTVLNASCTAPTEQRCLPPDHPPFVYSSEGGPPTATPGLPFDVTVTAVGSLGVPVPLVATRLAMHVECHGAQRGLALGYLGGVTGTQILRPVRDIALRNGSATWTGIGFSGSCPNASVIITCLTSPGSAVPSTCSGHLVRLGFFAVGGPRNSTSAPSTSPVLNASHPVFQLRLRGVDPTTLSPSGLDSWRRRFEGVLLEDLHKERIPVKDVRVEWICILPESANMIAAVETGGPECSKATPLRSAFHVLQESEPVTCWDPDPCFPLVLFSVLPENASNASQLSLVHMGVLFVAGSPNSTFFNEFNLSTSSPTDLVAFVSRAPEADEPPLDADTPTPNVAQPPQLVAPYNALVLAPRDLEGSEGYLPALLAPLLLSILTLLF